MLSIIRVHILLGKILEFLSCLLTPGTENLSNS